MAIDEDIHFEVEELSNEVCELASGLLDDLENRRDSGAARDAIRKLERIAELLDASEVRR